MKKKIPLMVNEPLKHELELSANVILEKIRMVQSQTNKNLGINIDNPIDTIAFINKYSKETDFENEKKINELLLIKFEKEVKKLMDDYPSLIKLKALEMFCTSSDMEEAKQIIRLAVSINFSMMKLGQNIDLEHFLLNDEFVYNSKIDTRLKEAYTTYCKNKKQVELLELAEKLKSIVKLSIKVGLISDKTIGINIENIMNLNTGDIMYNKIAMMQ